MFYPKTFSLISLLLKKAKSKIPSFSIKDSLAEKGDFAFVSVALVFIGTTIYFYSTLGFKENLANLIQSLIFIATFFYTSFLCFYRR